MKKVLLICSICMLSVLTAFGQMVNQEGTGFRSDFDVAGTDDAPCWIGVTDWVDGEEIQVYEAVRTENNTALITGMGLNPEYSPVWYGFNHECGEAQEFIDISDNPVINIRARGAEGTNLQVHVADENGNATNCDNCMNNGVVTLTEEWQEFEISVAEFLCQYGATCEAEDGGVAVDASSIGNVNLTINPGSVNNEEVWVELDYIVVGSFEEEEQELPATPGNFTATAISDTEVELSWDVVEGADEYIVEWTQEGGEWQELTVPADTELPYVVGDLESATSYSFRIAANVGGLLSEFSDVVGAMTEGAVEHPDALEQPQNVEIALNAGNSVTVNLDPVPNATGYRLEYAPRHSNDWSELRIFEAVPWNSGDLTNSEDNYTGEGVFDFRVVAVYDADEDGVHLTSEPSEISTVIVGDVELVPANLTATPISESEIQLDWNELDYPVDEYIISWQQVGAPAEEWNTVSVAGDVNTHVVPELAAGTSYNFMIASVIADETSENSDIVTESTDNPTSAAKSRMRVELSMFPNPSNGLTQIDYEAVAGMDIQIKITSSMGDEVESFSGTTNGASFDVSSLNAGIYLVYILADGEIVGVERLVVQ